eukprot:7538989-Alexandrium_andersonii.AAC.1
MLLELLLVQSTCTERRPPPFRKWCNADSESVGVDGRGLGPQGSRTNARCTHLSTNWSPPLRKGPSV